MSKYKISQKDLEIPGGITRLIADGHTKQDVLNAIHAQTDDHTWGHRNRTEQRELVQELFDRNKS